MVRCLAVNFGSGRGRPKSRTPQCILRDCIFDEVWDAGAEETFPRIFRSNQTKAQYHCLRLCTSNEMKK